MSTDDSGSEDVSTSAALSHNNADASAGKESEASVISSEDTLSGPAGPEEHRDRVRSVRALQGFFQSAAAAVTGRSPQTPASDSPKSRSLCLGPQEFGCGRSLPSINPSPLETLTALVQEIRTGGETDPELWKGSEGRWLQLFKLVEKQYQEQIFTQQEQYQCQIQLIQDEIKALVQLQNRPITTQPADDWPAHTPADSPLSDPAALALSPSANPLELHRQWAGPAVTGGCKAAPEPSLCRGGQGGCGGEERDEHQQLPPVLPARSTTAPPAAEEEITAPPPLSASRPSPPSLPANQSGTSSRPLTTWAQRERCWGRRCRWARVPQEVLQEEVPHERSPRARHLENVRSRAQSPEPFYLHKGDILESHPSGLGSWRVGESESLSLRPEALPQGTAVPLGSPEEARLSVSLKETYQRNLRGTSSHDRRSLFSSKASPLQVRRPRPASSFTSPFRFSSPSFPTQSLPCPPGGAPVTPSPTAEGSPGLLFDRTPPPGLTSMAVLSPAASPTWGQSARGGGAHSPEDAPLLRPGPPPRADPRLPPQAGGALERSPTLEDPVILSLARQSLREQTARLQADYESQISALQEKLSLANRPPSSDQREANQILQDRCENLERSVMETRSRARALEEQNLHLERQLSEWQGRYDLTSATVTTLHERLEAANQSCREKEVVEERLRARLQLLEEAQVQAYRLSDDTDAQRKQEHNMLRDLLVEYDTLGKDHERVKDKLVSTEDKLFDAIAQISELKRVVSKLESQVKQLEHESLKTRHLTRSQSQRSGAGLYHHPDLLLSPGRSLADLDTSSRRWADTGPALDQSAAHTSRHYPSPEKEEMPVAEAPPRREAPPGPLVLTEESRSPDGRGPPRPEGQGPLSSGRRGDLMAPHSERSSPKRCPSENYSTAFGPAPSWSRHSHTWSDVRLDQRAVMSPSPSNSCNAKKRLQFSEETEANHQPSSGKEGLTSGAEPIERAVGVAWEEHGAEPPHPYATPLSCHNRLQSLADTERLFDQLTLEKKQIESSLSRLPSPTGGRGTLQARLEEEALEARLEKVNRELGSIRMTLKRFHVLRSSTNN